MTVSDRNSLDSLKDLLDVMAMLRDPDHGCPWDIKQTPASLVRYTLEEVYEVVDAIESGDTDQLKEELGDLLFQIVFYARIAQEQKWFDFSGIAVAISEKLIRRHPHVFPEADVARFGQAQTLTAEEVVSNWELIKSAERAQQNARRPHQEPGGLLDDVPRALPAVERAVKLQRRAASVGFDWTDFEPVIAKIQEELDELKHAIATGDRPGMNEELGDTLFAVVNLARHIDADPEACLRATNKKFADRFRFMEKAIQAQGRQMTDLKLAELDHYWEKAKHALD